MRRRLLNLLTALSLLVCVAVVVLWVRSYVVSDWVSRYWVTGRAGGADAVGCVLLTGDGRLRVEWSSYSWPRPKPHVQGGTMWETQPAAAVVQDWFDTSSLRGRAGFGWAAGVHANNSGDMVRQRVVVFPLWLVAGALSLLPAARLYRRMRRRYPTGHCPTCGYDLRATPDRCPECGNRGGRSDVEPGTA